MTTSNLMKNREAAASCEDNPAEAAGWNRLGLYSFQRGDLRAALSHFQEAARQSADCAEAWNNHGLVLQTLGHHAEAIADFDRAMSARADYAEALNNRGRSREALGDFSAALADFEQALACASSPFAASVLHNRAALRQTQGDLSAALADFDRALQLDPAHAITYVNRGTARKEAGDLAGALADCEQALAMLPPRQQAAVYHLRGGVRAQQNDFAAALADYDRALALEPANYIYHVSRGHARYHLRHPRAVADYRLAFRLNPHGTAREMMRFLTADVRRDADGVLKNCAQHLRLNPADSLAHARRGLTLVLLDRAEEALLDFSRFVDLNPEAWDDLCRVIDLARSYHVGAA